MTGTAVAEAVVREAAVVTRMDVVARSAALVEASGKRVHAERGRGRQRRHRALSIARTRN